jgi:hypothetical protein
VWSSRWSHIMRGSWCPHCSGRKRGSIEYMNELAERNGGHCISKTYKNSHTHLDWECDKEHRWKAKPNNIQQGQWCPTCRRVQLADKQRTPYAVIASHAVSQRGRLISRTYTHNKEKLEWECDKGHRWKSSVNSVINQGTWCPTCAGEKISASKLSPTGLDDLKRIANERGGELLSKSYKGTARKYRWRCKNGHEWDAVANNIKVGRWCPECGGGLGERITRAFFEQMFGTSFHRVRPDWLTTEDGRKLELDGYASELKIAFEHQGRQHFKPVPKFGGTREDLLAQQNRDARKRSICATVEVKLIEVPEVPSQLPVPNLQKFILEECIRLGIKVPDDAATKEINLVHAYSFGPLQRFREAARERNGRLISKHFKGYHRRHTWECEQGHQWKSSPNPILYQGTWCPKCGGNARRTIEEMREVALSRGGDCLSKEYHGAHKKLLWQCSKGHSWSASPTSVVSGSWCPECAGSKPNTLLQMQELARERGGSCLSSVYVNSKIKLRWRCSKKHEWEAIPLNVKNKGSWCPTCANQARRK